MPGTLEEAGTAISRVISICRDAEQGFRVAANASRDPVGIRTILESQRVEIEKAHDYLRQRRDATAPKQQNAAR